ncbi:MAG: hypothetical protein IJV33_07940 [Bacteroidaceae bacterium]|nr:hypothetical protein [Bacteroidaceae bacterium]
MGEKTEQRTLRRGFFPLHLRVDDRLNENARELLLRFLQRLSESYDLQVLEEPTERAEATIAVPFPDKERVRVEFNVFASEVEDACGDPLRYYFFMESQYN